MSDEDSYNYSKLVYDNMRKQLIQTRYYSVKTKYWR